MSMSLAEYHALDAIGNGRISDFVPGWWDVSEDDYHSSPLVSRGMLYTMLRESSAYYQAEYEQRIITTNVTRAMMLGRLVHIAVLEPERWDAGFCRPPPADVCSPEPAKPVPADGTSAQSKAHKENLAIWRDQHAAWSDANARALAEYLRGREIVPLDQWEQVLGMSESVARHKRASELLSGATVVTERAMRWVDAESGIPMRAKPDASNARPEMADLKSIGQAPSPENVARIIGSSWYHGQAAVYSDGFKAITGEMPSPFSDVFVRSSQPYECAVWEISPRAIELGRREYRKALRDIAEHRELNDWAPWWTKEPFEIDVPSWVYDQSSAWMESFGNG